MRKNELSARTGAPLLHKEFTQNFALLASIEQWTQDQEDLSEPDVASTTSPGDDSDEAGSKDGSGSQGSKKNTENLADPEQRLIDRTALDDLYATTAGDSAWVNIDGWDEV